MWNYDYARDWCKCNAIIDYLPIPAPFLDHPKSTIKSKPSVRKLYSRRIMPNGLEGCEGDVLGASGTGVGGGKSGEGEIGEEAVVDSFAVRENGHTFPQDILHGSDEFCVESFCDEGEVIKLEFECKACKSSERMLDWLPALLFFVSTRRESTTFWRLSSSQFVMLKGSNSWPDDKSHQQ